MWVRQAAGPAAEGSNVTCRSVHAAGGVPRLSCPAAVLVLHRSKKEALFPLPTQPWPVC